MAEENAERNLAEIAGMHPAHHLKSVQSRNEMDFYEATYWQRRQRAAFQARAALQDIGAAKIAGFDPEEVYEGQFAAPIGEN